MIILRHASNDFNAFKTAEIFDKNGIRIVAIMLNTQWSLTMPWCIFGQSDTEINFTEVDKQIDAYIYGEAASKGEGE